MKKIIPGGCLTFGGLFLFAGFLASTRPHEYPVDLVLLFLFSFLPIATGVGLFVSHFRSKRKEVTDERTRLLLAHEKEALMLAQRYEGKLTIAQLVTDSSMDLNQAEETMNELLLKQIVMLRSTEDGNTYYELVDVHLSPEQPSHPIVRPDKLRE